MTSMLKVALGTHHFGTVISADNAFRVMDEFASLGGRILDTANCYAHWVEGIGQGGQSESVVGRWLKKNDRDKFTVITKVGAYPAGKDGDRQLYEGLSAPAIHAAIAKSLERLRLETVDILLAHHDYSDTPLAESWGAFSELVEKEQATRIGISNYSASRLRELSATIEKHNFAPLSAIEMKYSLLSCKPMVRTDMLEVLDTEIRSTIDEIFPEADIFGYSPLLGGIYAKNDGDPWPEEYDTPENRRKVSEIRENAQKSNASIPAMVLKSIADNGVIPITSTSKPERLRDNLKLLFT